MSSNSTAGHLPFRVVVTPNPVNLARFGKAVVRSDVKVTDTFTGFKVSDPWQVIVWIRPQYIPIFESLCLPTDFVLLTHQEALKGF